MRIAYRDQQFTSRSLTIIDTANDICAEYQGQGYDLTLRQLYYQFVSRGLIPNKDTEYKRLGSIINDARMAGLLDWDYIVDRTRNLRSLGHWGSPADILNSAADGYRVDLWANQAYRREVWIEKDALVGVIEGPCELLDGPYFSCRGYTSQSEMWGAAQRIRRWNRANQMSVVLHFGAPDPSGIDMTRDITDRLETFGADFELRRFALNMDQVDQYNPPPNPAKITDSRSESYIREYGHESWELDALEPRVIGELIDQEIRRLIDQEVWDQDQMAMEEDKERLRELARDWQ